MVVYPGFHWELGCSEIFQLLLLAFNDVDYKCAFVVSLMKYFEGFSIAPTSKGDCVPNLLPAEITWL